MSSLKIRLDVYNLNNAPKEFGVVTNIIVEPPPFMDQDDARVLLFVLWSGKVTFHIFTIGVVKDFFGHDAGIDGNGRPGY